jgi:hypothetical protein
MRQLVSRILALYSVVTQMIGQRDFIVFNYHESFKDNILIITQCIVFRETKMV